MTDVFPDPIYRPIPMTWFAAAAVGQSVGLAVLYLGPIAIWGAGALWITAAGAIWTGYLVYRLWPRKLSEASLAWRAATATTLVLQFAMFALACLTSMGG